MGYYDVALLAADQDFASRTTAAYAQEALGEEWWINPPGWQAQHNWQMAAAPGFGDKYAYALAQEPPNPAPGKDPSVISDAEILAAVQFILNAENPGEPTP